MRPTPLLFISVFAFMAAALPAQAQDAGFTGKTKALTQVSDTKLKDLNGQILDLCHRTEDRHLMGHGIWVTSKGYVLAKNKCETDTYFTLSTAQLEQAQLEGNIPETVPKMPEFNETQTVDQMRGYTLTALIGVLLLLVAIIGAVIFKRRSATQRFLQSQA